MPVRKVSGISCVRKPVNDTNMKTLKRASFGLLGAVLLVLTAATVAEKIYGTPFIAGHVYHAGWFVALWGALAVTAGAYIFRRRLQRRPVVFLLHAAFAVILAGAFVTWLTGRQGTLHLRVGDRPAPEFTAADGTVLRLPFGVTLEEFRIDYYPGTRAPMDFVSRIALEGDAGIVREEVAMNRIARFEHYRFYQSSYDADGGGSTLAVSHDPWGIGITYAGYLLLLAAMVAFFFDRNSTFRCLLRHPALKRTALLVLFAAGAFSVQAAGSKPQTLPRDVAEELGGLYVYYNDRICPLATLAKDFTVKLCGKSSYRGYTSEQVAAGWLFYYDVWKEEPMLCIRSGEARRLLGIGGRYARLTDFGAALRERRTQGCSDRGVDEADEKFNLVSMLCTGSMLRLFPYADPVEGTLRWASQVNDLPEGLPREQALFIRQSMNYVNELVAKRDYAELSAVLGKIRAYQRKICGGERPSDLRFEAERVYNRLGGSLPLAAALIVVGAAAFVDDSRRLLNGRRGPRVMERLLVAGLALSFACLTGMIALRGYVAGHWPLSNGFETMQFMAWCALGLTLLFRSRFLLIVPFGYLVAGLAMMVSMMGESNPQITPLMPVLSSPLLSVHVVLVMAAYALLAFVMFNGATGLLLGRCHPDSAVQLQVVSRILLYPAVLCLAAGIFVGAVWANVSWGRYWGWDPKEVWALITLLVYSLALHAESLPWFRRPAFFHGFCIAAFLCVVITYFGVNFLLGGMHGYI